MSPIRVLQLSMVILMLFGSTWIVRMAGLEPSATGGTSTWLNDQTALAGVLNGDNGGNNNSNSNNSNSNNSNANSNNSNSNNSNSNANSNNSNSNNSNANSNNSNSNNSNSNSNGNGNGNGNSNNNGNDNFNLDLPPLPSSSSSTSSQPKDPGCAEPGQEATFFSRDGKVAVHVFANRSERVRIEILPVIDFLSAPLPPGNLVGLLAYEIRASHCDGVPLVDLPAEMNLAIHYTDLEATGLDEKRFVIGHLNIADGTWYPMEKRATDTANNVVTATISQTGFYMVWEER